MPSGLADKGWERMQKKTFTKWVNMHLAKRGKKSDELLETFNDGTLLATLLDILTGEFKGKIRPAEKCKMSIHKTENIQQCLNFITKDKGVRLLNIDAGNIYQGHPMLTLALVWMLILHLDVDELSAEELNAKEALLLWCQKKTSGYNGVDPPGVKNFHKSWKSGLAFCALIHKHKPGLIDYDNLDHADDAGNLEKAFAAAEGLGIPRFLDVEDMVEQERPDEKSVMTYLFQYYRYFAAGNKAETAARRIAKLVALTKLLDSMKEDYNVKSGEWAAWVAAKTEELAALQPENSLEGVQSAYSTFNTYKKDEKPPKAGEKTELEVLLSSIQLKLKNAGRPVFVPEDGRSAEDIANLWKGLLAAEKACSANLKAELKRQRTLVDLVKRFNRLADKLTKFGADKNGYLAVVEQIDTLNAAQSKLQLHQAFFTDLESSKKGLQRAQDLAQQIDSLNYSEKDAVNARAAELSATWDELQAGGDAKQQRLEEAVAREEKKNELRKEFATTAKSAKDKIKVWMGTQVAGFGANLDQLLTTPDDFLKPAEEEMKQDTANQLAAVKESQAQLDAAGVTSNEYTPLTTADIQAQYDEVHALFAQRWVNYEKELAEAQALDNKQKDFAEAAKNVYDAISAQQDVITNCTEGSEDEKIATAQEALAKNAELQAQIAAAQALDQEIKDMITRTQNQHSQFSMEDLNRQLASFNVQGQQFIATCEENKQYAARTVEQDAARAARSLAEQQAVSFATTANQLVNWMDGVDDNLAEDLTTLTSMDQVDTQEALYNTSAGEVGAQQAKLDELSATAAAMTEAGNTDFGATSLEDVQGKFAATTAALDERKAAIATAKDKQAADEQLRTAFVAAATDLSNFIAEQQAAVAADAAGSLEEQLEAANALAVARNSTGVEKVGATNAANEALGEANVSAEAKTDLSAEGLSSEFEQLGDAIQQKVGVIQSEIAAQSNSDIPAEKIAEFKEVFAHFDKNSNGVLSHLEFSGCLQSLGEERSEQDLKLIYQNLDKDNSGSIEFQEFLEFMISITQDQDTEEEIVSAFRVLTNDADFITEAQIREVMQGEEADYLVANMPACEGGFDYKSWTGAAYSR